MSLAVTSLESYLLLLYQRCQTRWLDSCLPENPAPLPAVQTKLQALVYDILPPTRSIIVTPEDSENCQLTISFSLVLKRQ